MDQAKTSKSMSLLIRTLSDGQRAVSAGVKRQIRCLDNLLDFVQNYLSIFTSFEEFELLRTLNKQFKERNFDSCSEISADGHLTNHLQF